MKFLLLKLHLRFKSFAQICTLYLVSFFCLSNDLETYSNSAYLRFRNKVILRSEAMLTLRNLEYLNCVFGPSVFYKSSVKDSTRVKRFHQLEAYLEDKGFDIPQKSYFSLIKKLKKNNCINLKFKEFSERKNFIKIEVFLQESYLGVSPEEKKLIWKNLKKMLDSKYPVYFYEA